jgi:hypothetical protein
VLTRRHAAAYATWRAAQRRRQRRQQQKQDRAWGFGSPEDPASPMTSPGSEDGGGGGGGGGSSGSSGNGGCRAPSASPLPEALVLALPPPLAARIQEARAGRRPRRSPAHHPADWQYVAAQRTLRALSLSPAGAMAVAALLAHLYSWHRSMFP